MKKLVLLLLALVFAMGACVALAEEPTIYTSGNYEYILLDDGTAVITRYLGSEESVSIPAELDGHVVTSIGDWAFDYCRSLTSITIPDSVTSIGESAFARCDSLTSINVSAENPIFASINGVLFEKATKTLVCYPRGIKADSYSIPSGIKVIGDRAFDSCSALTSITIPDSVTSIGDIAFYRCRALTNITIPDSVTTIGDYAFYNCDALTSITVPDSVTTIGERAFYYCDALTSITIPDSVTTIGKAAFSRCPNLTLTVSRDSFALQYCKDNSLYYTYPDALDWLNN